jgi:hypothetical protein
MPEGCKHALDWNQTICIGLTIVVYIEDVRRRGVGASRSVIDPIVCKFEVSQDP